jgi:hypothetical protein
MEIRCLPRLLTEFTEIVRLVFRAAKGKIPYADIAVRIEPGNNGQMRTLWKWNQTREDLLPAEGGQIVENA